MSQRDSDPPYIPISVIEICVHVNIPSCGKKPEVETSATYLHKLYHTFAHIFLKHKGLGDGICFFYRFDLKEYKLNGWLQEKWSICM